MRGGRSLKTEVIFSGEEGDTIDQAVIIIINASVEKDMFLLYQVSSEALYG